MISNTALADIIKRNTDTPNLQAKLFIEAALPTHVKPHVTPPVVIDRHGHKGPPFINDGM
jgi:hypothetical protein